VSIDEAINLAESESKTYAKKHGFSPLDLYQSYSPAEGPKLSYGDRDPSRSESGELHVEV